MHSIRVDEAMSGTGLFVRCALHPREDDCPPFPAGTFVLIGNAGPAMWRAFRARVPEAKRAGLADPPAFSPGAAAGAIASCGTRQSG